MACTPAMAASSGSFSPMRRATIAVVDSETPSPIANTSASIDSVRPTVATASAPSRPTQNTSTTANRDSSTISSTMGMASRRMERFRLPWCSPGASRAGLRVPNSRSSPRWPSAGWRRGCLQIATWGKLLQAPQANTPRRRRRGSLCSSIQLCSRITRG